MDVHFTSSPKLIMACVILHNIVEKAGMPFYDVWTDEIEHLVLANPQPEVVPEVVLDNDIQPNQIRDALKVHMANTLPLRRSMLAWPV